MESASNNNQVDGDASLSKAQIRKKKIRKIFIIIFVILAPFLVLGSVASYFEDKEFLDNHEKVLAKVISTRLDTYEGRKGRETNAYRVSYKLNINNSAQTGELPITPPQFSTIKAGDEMEVVYNKNNPNQHQFLDVLQKKASISGLLESVFFSLFSILLIIGIFYYLLTKIFCREAKN